MGLNGCACCDTCYCWNASVLMCLLLRFTEMDSVFHVSSQALEEKGGMTLFPWMRCRLRCFSKTVSLLSLWGQIQCFGMRPWEPLRMCKHGPLPGKALEHIFHVPCGWVKFYSIENKCNVEISILTRGLEDCMVVVQGTKMLPVYVYKVFNAAMYGFVGRNFVS